MGVGSPLGISNSGQVLSQAVVWHAYTVTWVGQPELTGAREACHRSIHMRTCHQALFGRAGWWAAADTAAASQVDRNA